jgi:hypothetical protein
LANGLLEIIAPLKQGIAFALETGRFSFCILDWRTAIIPFVVDVT